MISVAMTPKQIERHQGKILKIKRALAADKKRWGGYYDDSRGLRYLPPEIYLKLEDYSGALKYFKWFDKNFPDDCGYPIFLFEWTITLFKTGNIKAAEKKALQTFISNAYLIDKFLVKEVLYLDKNESSSWELPGMIEKLKYSNTQTELQDFADWLSKFVTSEQFYKVANEFIEIKRKLKTEPVGPKRSLLVSRSSSLLDDYNKSS
jgi:hypothetical protein